MNNIIRRVFSVVVMVLVLIASLPTVAFASLLVNEIEEYFSDALENEIVASREENIKHFRLSNGNNVAIQYSDPVHYKDENGEYKNTNMIVEEI